jgi:hypothetical protein
MRRRPQNECRQGEGYQRGLKYSGKDVIVRRPLCSDASSSEDNSDMEFDSDDTDGENDTEPVPPSAAFLGCAIPCAPASLLIRAL